MQSHKCCKESCTNSFTAVDPAGARHTLIMVASLHTNSICKDSLRGSVSIRSCVGLSVMSGHNPLRRTVAVAQEALYCAKRTLSPLKHAPEPCVHSAICLCCYKGTRRDAYVQWREARSAVCSNITLPSKPPPPPRSGRHTVVGRWAQQPLHSLVADVGAGSTESRHSTGSSGPAQGQGCRERCQPHSLRRGVVPAQSPPTRTQVFGSESIFNLLPTSHIKAA